VEALSRQRRTRNTPAKTSATPAMRSGVMSVWEAERAALVQDQGHHDLAGDRDHQQLRHADPRRGEGGDGDEDRAVEAAGPGIPWQRAHIGDAWPDAERQHRDHERQEPH
jgi:hypothetical protein